VEPPVHYRRANKDGEAFHMSSFQILGSFLKVWGPWITLSLIPTLIVGLSKSPKTRGFVDILKYALQFLSVVTPADHAGTFKAPLTATVKLPPKKDEPPDLPGPPKGKRTPTPLGPAIMILCGSLLGLGVSNVAGCSWFTTVGKGSREGVINCGIESVMSDAKNLYVTIRAIVTGGAVNWKEQLDSLKTLGEDALACALQVVGDELQQQSVPPTDAAGDSPAKSKMRAVSAQGARKTELYLQEKNWKPTGATSK
jgi:hypothetical protein